MEHPRPLLVCTNVCIIFAHTGAGVIIVTYFHIAIMFSLEDLILKGDDKRIVNVSSVAAGMSPSIDFTQVILYVNKTTEVTQYQSIKLNFILDYKSHHKILILKGQCHEKSFQIETMGF